MTIAEWAALVDAVLAYRRTGEHARQAWLLAERLREAGW